MTEWEGAGTRQQLPFRRLFQRLSRPVPEDAAIVTAYTDGEVTLRSNRAKERYHEASDLSTYQGVEPGDFVVHGLDILRGSVGVADSRGAMSPVCVVCRARENAEGRFMAYAMRLQSDSGFPKAMARGVRDGGADFRRWETLAELPLPCPPLAEQRAIADFLDRETGKIDALIEKQTELIARLQERRVAVVQLAVRPTTTWTGTRVKHIADTVLGKMLDGARRSRPDDVVAPYVRAADVLADGSINTVNLNEMPFSPGELTSLDLRRGDVLLIEGGATVGRPGLVNRDLPGVAFQKTVNRLRVRRAVDSGFAYWSLLARYESGYYQTHFEAVSFVHLTGEKLRQERLDHPPLDQQREIVQRLERETAKLDELIGKTERMIELSRERRSALITAAVTGQIDVNEHGGAA